MAQPGSIINKSVYEQLHAIKANDEEALKTLYLNNYGKIEAFITENNGSKEEAKDIFQEAFIAVWRNIQLDKFHPENESALDGYLYRVAKNKWIDYLRSGHYTKVVRLSEKHEPGADEIPAEENDYIQAVRKHFKSLGKNCREILTGFYYRNESLKQIAKAMGWTEQTARNNKYRCIRQLKEFLQNK